MPVIEERLITWSNFHRTYLEDGHANLVAAPGSPHVEFYVEEGAGRIGLRTPCRDTRAIKQLRLSKIDVRRVMVDEESLLDLSTQSTDLFRQFFELLRDIADRIQVNGEEVIEAATGAVRNLWALGKTEGLMSSEAQHGLYGELLALQRLRAGGVLASLDGWTGPLKDPHDFRLGSVEIEVKTRVGARRIHRIHDLGQLRATVDRELYVLSVLLCGSADGMTLPDLIAKTRGTLDIKEHLTFKERLATYGGKGRGYKEEDAPYYCEKLALRAPLQLIPVDSSVPALTTNRLAGLFCGGVSSRLGQVSYEVDFDSLGVADQSIEFLSIIPAGG